MIHYETAQVAQEATDSSNAAQLVLGSLVIVRLLQRVPNDDPTGPWKDTGLGFDGTLVNGPDSRINDPETGKYHYVLPEEGGIHGNVHPIQISGMPFDAYGQVSWVTHETDPKAGHEALCFTVEALRREISIVQDMSQ